MVLRQISEISETSASIVLSYVNEGLKEGWAIAEIQQAIVDSGAFEPTRALMLSRTISGNAANAGQYKGAQLTGATHKTWITAGSAVRKSHKKLNNTTIPVNDLFKVGGHSAYFPLDNRLPPGERVNCRCTLSYEIQD